MNDKVPQIYGLVSKVMADIGAVSKSRKNEQQKYSFRGIEDFYQAAHPAMIAHGMFCAPEVLERIEYRFEKTNDQGRVTTWIHVALKVAHRFYAPDGSSVTVTTWGEGLDNSDKATNKAMSGAMKYALIELFCVPTQDVEDADRTSPEAGTAPKANGKPVERIDAEIPLEGRAMPPADQLVSVEQAQKLHKRFRDELREEIKKHADGFLHEWLGMKMFLDADGNPSAKAIPKNVFAAVGKEAMEYARGL